MVVMKLQEILRSIFPTHETFQEFSEKSLSPQIGNIIVVNYATKEKILRYIGVVPLTSGETFYVQYLKNSGGKTFSLKLGDEDTLLLKVFSLLLRLFL